MSHPGEATAADELLVALLSDDVRQALRRLGAAGVLLDALDVTECDDGPNGCACDALDQYDADDLVNAYTHGYADALDGARETLAAGSHLTKDEALVGLRRAGVL